MEFTGKLANVSVDWQTGQPIVSFTVNEVAALNDIESIQNIEKLVVKAEKWKKKRSLDANAMLWACLSDIAKAMNPPVDKWEVYLQMLKRYGKFTYICVKPNAVEAMKAQWRECEVVGDININGSEAVQMLCYFGSSTYDSKEFSVLLEGVVSEMKEMGLTPPPSGDMKRALEQWGLKRENSISKQ